MACALLIFENSKREKLSHQTLLSLVLRYPDIYELYYRYWALINSPNYICAWMFKCNNIPEKQHVISIFYLLPNIQD